LDGDGLRIGGQSRCQSAIPAHSGNRCAQVRVAPRLDEALAAISCQGILCHLIDANRIPSTVTAQAPMEGQTPPAPGRARTPLPAIALVGRPNVGKSTLFNRLTRSRQALVTNVPGTTRDRREGEVSDGVYRFRLVDTGGMGFGMALAFSREVEAQIDEAVRGADYVWVVLDAKEGLNPFDEDLHRWVMRLGKPYRVVLNKADNPGRRGNLAEFYALGTDRLHAVSAAHGLGIDGLLEATARELPGLRAAPRELPGLRAEPREGEAGAEAPVAPGALRVAFLGRPNVGKSSLVNRILGQSRMIVSETAGTTREAVETPFRVFGRDYVLVDTAGIRRRARTQEHLEKLGVLHTLGSLNWVQVAVLVVDASDEVATQDARIASYVMEHRRAVVVAMNKWDRLGGGAARAKAVEADIRERLRFLSFAAFVRTSAVEGAAPDGGGPEGGGPEGGGLETLFREVGRAAAQFRREIQTADLNRVVQAASLRFPPPAQRGSSTRIYYGTQVGTEPPAFRFFTNHPKQIDDAYTRFFENQLRHHFGLQGTPLRIEWRARRPEEERPPRPARDKRAPRPPKSLRKAGTRAGSQGGPRGGPKGGPGAKVRPGRGKARG
jgi:GTP-binding protein